MTILIINCEYDPDEPEENIRSIRKDYLARVSNYQKVHNSLEVFGIGEINNVCDWNNEELEIINCLKDQGVRLENSHYFTVISG